ncbi:MAG: SCO family protein [Desulfurococcales archaeon]|nr:SCO family protein [Desulfurococcales archaeon]
MTRIVPGGLKFVFLVMTLVISMSVGINAYMYFEGYYPKAREEVSKTLEDVAGVFNLSSPMFPLMVNVTDGERVFEAEVPVKGKITIFVPQYVNCPDICHIESMVMMGVMSKLVRDGLAGEVVWVTVEVDPEGSTSKDVMAYMRSIAGSLYGEFTWYWVLNKDEKLEKLWGQIGIQAERDPNTGLVGHTAGFYIADRNGVLLYYVRPNIGITESGWDRPGDLAEGIYRLVKGMILGDQGIQE